MIYFSQYIFKNWVGLDLRHSFGLELDHFGGGLSKLKLQGLGQGSI